MAKALVLAASLGVACAIAAGPAVAQAGDYQPPKLSWKVPDLTGAWSNASVTSLERPDGVKNLVLTPEEAQAIEGSNYNNVRDAKDRQRTDPNQGAPPKGITFPLIGNYNTAYIDAGTRMATVNGEIRSSWIIDPPDGKVPWKDAKAKAVALAFPYEDDISGAASAYLGPESRGGTERCLWANGPVMLNGIYNANFQIVQSPESVVINVEMAHDARIIPIVKSAAEARSHFGPIPKWLGDSVGWYEGNTFVIETRNTHPEQTGYSMLGASGVVTERFTRVGPDEILYEFKIVNPTFYSQPWKGEIEVKRLNGPVYEYACHEGNYGLTNILLGARVQEAKGLKLTHAGIGE